jgi:hypothetical protein
MEACYWLEWLIEFYHVCKKRSQPCKCERRYEIPVETKFQCELIWMIWDGLFYNTKQSGNTFVNAVMTSLLDLFCIKFLVVCVQLYQPVVFFLKANLLWRSYEFLHDNWVLKVLDHKLVFLIEDLNYWKQLGYIF